MLSWNAMKERWNKTGFLFLGWKSISTIPTGIHCNFTENFIATVFFSVSLFLSSSFAYIPICIKVRHFVAFSILNWFRGEKEKWKQSDAIFAQKKKTKTSRTSSSTVKIVHNLSVPMSPKFACTQTVASNAWCPIRMMIALCTTYTSHNRDELKIPTCFSMLCAIYAPVCCC